MILNDIAEVLYAPTKAFKRIVANPKYLGVLIVVLLFLGISIGFEYSQFAHTFTEQTYPPIFFFNGQLINGFPSYINATSGWASNGNLTNNNQDFFNYTIYLAGTGAPATLPDGYLNIFENTSLQISAMNTNAVQAALQNTTDPTLGGVDCAANHFQNLSLTLKLVQPQSAPQNATVTLYSLADGNSYTYDITSLLKGSGQWENLTLPVGPSAQGWIVSGNPTWQNITSIKLAFNYSSNQDITVRIGGLYFGGWYFSPAQNGAVGIIIEFLQVFSLQLIFSWLVMTAIIYALCRFLAKNAVLWKPVFIAIGFAMIVMAIRMVVSLLATLTMGATYYPFDIAQGARFDAFATLYYPTEATGYLSASSQAALPLIQNSVAIFRTITAGMAVISYVWLAALGAVVIGTLKPEFSVPKRIGFSAISVALMILLLLFFFGIV